MGSWIVQIPDDYGEEYPEVIPEPAYWVDERQRDGSFARHLEPPRTRVIELGQRVDRTPDREHVNTIGHRFRDAGYDWLPENPMDRMILHVGEQMMDDLRRRLEQPLWGPRG